MSYTDFKQKYHIHLDAQQEAAVQAIDGYVLLLAVPGSGKTTVLVNRLGYMILDQGIAPANILTVTYTVAATKDMQRRFARIFGGTYEGNLEFRTINSLSQQILNYYGSITGKKAFGVIENQYKSGLIKNIFRLVNDSFATEIDVKNIETAITYVKNMRLSTEEIDELDVDVDDFPEIYARYQRELSKQCLIDFDDQMVYAYKLLDKVPAVRDYFQSKYKYICVDEAQDTSKLQHDMIQLLASRHGNLFMVGDEDQSIYGFRAAYPEALVSFEEVHPGASIFLMESNYRSKEEIVTSANKLIKRNEIRHEKHMRATRPAGGHVTGIEVRSRKAQITYLTKVAAECREETAVLYRNNESALPLIDLLERNNIRFKMKSNEMLFFSNLVVSDISDFIRLALNPSDADAFLRIYFKMGIGLSKKNANLIVDYNAGTHSLMEAIDDLDGISVYARKQSKELATHFAKMKQDSSAKAISRIVDCMGYGDYMIDHNLDSGKVEILKMLAYQEEKLEDFLPRLEHLQGMISNYQSQDDSKFVLSTIHSSKGLEYDTVYLLDMIEGILPSISEPKGRNKKESDVALYEEERRLFYVGMTRAKLALYIFNFQDSETSAFTKEVLGKKSTNQMRTATRNGTHEITKMDEEKVKAMVEKMEQGVAVVHSRYGEGVITKRDDDTAEILFQRTGETRLFSIWTAVEKGLLFTN